MSPYEFVFKLHDMFSSPLTRIYENYNRVTGGMQKRMEYVNRLFAPMEKAMRRSFTTPQGTVAELIKQLDSLKQKAQNIDIRVNRRGLVEANRDIEWIERRIDKLQNMGTPKGRGLGMGGGGMPWLMAGGTAAALAYGAYNTAEAAAHKTIVPAMQRSTTLFQLNELTQNPTFVKGLEKQFAAYAPEKMGELFGASQKLMGAGIKQSELFGTIKTLNNLSALSNTKVDELAFIQSKVKATGYAQGDEMDMFRERGINLNSQIAEVLGIRNDQVKKAQEKGLITYEKFNKALEKFVGKGSLYEHVYERKRDSTPEGKYQYLAGQFNEKLIQLGVSALPTVNNALGYILKNSQQLSPLIDPLGKLAMSFNPVFKGFGGLLQQMGVLDEQFNISTGFVKGLADAIGGISKVTKAVSEMTHWAIDDFVKNTQKKSVFQSTLDKWSLPDEKQQRMLEQMQLHNKRAAFLRDLPIRRQQRRLDDTLDGDSLNSPDKFKLHDKELGRLSGLEASVASAKSSVTNIYIKSFAERFEINVETLNEGVDNVEAKFFEMFNKLLSSASSIDH